MFANRPAWRTTGVPGPGSSSPIDGFTRGLGIAGVGVTAGLKGTGTR